MLHGIYSGSQKTKKCLGVRWGFKFENKHVRSDALFCTVPHPQLMTYLKLNLNKFACPETNRDLELKMLTLTINCRPMYITVCCLFCSTSQSRLFTTNTAQEKRLKLVKVQISS